MQRARLEDRIAGAFASLAERTEAAGQAREALEWRKRLAAIRPLDAFVTDNPYVASLMRETYRVMRPVEFVAPADRVAIDGTTVRREMAKGDDAWRALVPSAVADYIVARGLDARFRREFGLETLAGTIIEE